MSEVTEWFPTETLHGDVMPWYGCVIEGNRWLILPGMTGRSPDVKQEYPEILEDEGFTPADEARLVTCPHSIEEQTELILEKIKAALDAHDTGFENVFNTDFFLTDRALWPAALKTMKRWMDPVCPAYFERPGPNVLSFVNGLGHRDMLIEIRMWATLPE
jgi:enamine deaminase RidA (YjgF/YER057c/UK114 family)